MGRNGKSDNYHKSMVIEEIAKKYFMCKKQKNIATCIIKLSEFDSVNSGLLTPLTARKYVKMINDVFSKLDNVQNMIIQKEFFINSEPFWWSSIYSRTTFYRLRSEAINHFLFLYNELNMENDAD